LNLSVEQVPPSLWSSLAAWVKSWVNCVVAIFFSERCDGSERFGVDNDGKRKDGNTQCECYIVRMALKVPQRHRQLNGDRVELVQDVAGGLLYERPGIAYMGLPFEGLWALAGALSDRKL
jgi:hypothetical protein